MTNQHVHDFSQQGYDAGFCRCGAIQYESLGEIFVLEETEPMTLTGTDTEPQA